MRFLSFEKSWSFNFWIWVSISKTKSSLLSKVDQVRSVWGLRINFLIASNISIRTVSTLSMFSNLFSLKYLLKLPLNLSSLTLYLILFNSILTTLKRSGHSNSTISGFCDQGNVPPNCNVRIDGKIS